MGNENEGKATPLAPINSLHLFLADLAGVSSSRAARCYGTIKPHFSWLCIKLLMSLAGIKVQS